MVNKTGLKFEFNLRDIKLFSTYEDIQVLPGQDIHHPIVHNIIISCFKNGLLFFQVTPRALEEISNSIAFKKNN